MACQELMNVSWISFCQYGTSDTESHLAKECKFVFFYVEFLEQGGRVQKRGGQFAKPDSRH